MAHSLELRVPISGSGSVPGSGLYTEKMEGHGRGHKICDAGGGGAPNVPNDSGKTQAGISGAHPNLASGRTILQNGAGRVYSPAAREFFRIPEILRLLDRHYRRKEDSGRKIWTIYMFLLWYRTCFEKNTGKPV